MRTKVNDLLATGASYAMVLRALGDDNATLEQRDRVTIDSIRNHCVRHFPVQQVARATYREILERRAKENSVDFIEGVATAVTPVAFLETVMVKGYQTLVDELTTVSYRDGMKPPSSTRSPARTRAPLTAPGCWPNDMRQPATTKATRALSQIAETLDRAGVVLLRRLASFPRPLCP